jgi:hypothetical protein
MLCAPSALQSVQLTARTRGQPGPTCHRHRSRGGTLTSGKVTTNVLSTSVRFYWRGWSAKGLTGASSTVAMAGGGGAWWQCQARLSLVESLVNLKETQVRVKGYGGVAVWSGHVQGVTATRARRHSGHLQPQRPRTRLAMASRWSSGDLGLGLGP